MHSPMFPRKQAIAHLCAEINWCIGFSFLQTLVFWFRTESQTLPSVAIIIIQLLLLISFWEARLHHLLELLKINSDYAVEVQTGRQAIRDTIGTLCPGRQQSHMHPWVLMCRHLGRKEISASHRSTFCWLCRDEQESENRNFGFGLPLTDQLQV